MIVPADLLAGLQRLLKRLEPDIRRRCEASGEIDARLRAEYERARSASRTAQAYEVWREDYITQVAVAWILGCVFVRFLEDTHLIDTVWLSGPDSRLQLARDQHEIYFQSNPTHTDREYLEHVFHEVAKLPSMRELLDGSHNPISKLGPTGDGAHELLEFWQKVDPSTGAIIHDFTDREWSTRFLGDLYQDLSESARDRYALLQTPEFVEEFILSRTLTPAVEEFGYSKTKMIDPACGSGHFLLGGFQRLLDLRLRNEPGIGLRAQVEAVLAQIFGVDINPFAVAIARFRLLIAALKACDIRRLSDSPSFRINVAAGDSLLHGPSPRGLVGVQRSLENDSLRHFYDIEDAEILNTFLSQSYEVVVGNPPYITVKDAALNLQAAAARFERYTGGKSLHRDVADAWAEAARRLFDRLEAAGNDQLLLMIVDRSDQILKDVRADRFAWLSEFSRIGFELRLDHVGQAISAVLTSEVKEVSREVREAAESVRSHRFAARLRSRANQVEMAVRLLQWLAAGGGAVIAEKLQSFEEAANAYAREGGFVDWARQCLFYGDPAASLSAAYGHLCELVTQQRENQNRRFAELMFSWMEAGCRSDTVVLIENVLKTTVLPAAEVAPVLLIVVDGMSFAVYRELIEDISRNGWVELTRKGEASKPSIATLPSVTEVSRRTLLSGKLTSGTGEDEKRNFAAQPDLVQVSKPGAPPILFQKSDLTDAGGSSLAGELRREIASPKRRVVAAIVNAVDDHLLKGEQVAVPWTLRHIPVLSHLLAAAMESGRLVIVTSDHGHVLDRQTSYRPSTAGERFRSDDGNVEPDEILIAGSRVVLPEGKVTVPWSERVRYGGKRNGYHGGASPQECVVPVAVLGWPNSMPEGYQALPPYEPEWWLIGGVEPIPITPLKVVTPVSKPQYSAEGQAELPLSGITAPRTWIDCLIDSPVFARQVAVAGRSAPAAERIRRFLFALDERGGTILRQALAQKLGEPELRIPGLIAALRRILNVDGYPVLSVDDSSGSVVLNRQLLEVQFEMIQDEANNV